MGITGWYNMKSKIQKILLSYKWIAKYIKEYTLSMILILLCNIINSLAGVAIAISSKNLVDHATSGNIRLIFYSLSIFAGIIIIKLGTDAASSLLAARTQEAFSNGMRQKLFARISGTEWTEISRYHSGDVLTRLTSDVGTVTNGVINVIPSVFYLGIQMVAAFATLLYFEPYLAILAFVLGPLTILFSRFWGHRLKKLHIKIQETESAYRSFIQESLENLTIVKAFRMEDRRIDTIGNLHDERMDLVLRRNRINVAIGTILSGGYWMGYLLAFGWGAVRLAQKAISYGTLTAFLQLVGQVQAPFIGLAYTLPRIIATAASVERIMELEALEMEKPVEKLPDRFSVEVILDEVYFSYNKEELVLEKASFDLKPGEALALIGSSGEGKTTIIRLILALLKPNRGQLFFRDDMGIDYPVNAATRDWIAYVPQGNTLFSGTIVENLKCGNPNASDDDLKEATIKACAWDFIVKLPDGLNTVLGEHGLGLSEGQAQRISIARAILRNAPVLILDEATSALDMDLEMRVLEGIKNLKPARACLVITHRLSALQVCSRVLKLQDGMLV